MSNVLARAHAAGGRNFSRPQTAALLRIQEDERRRIARELHDGINQQLAVLVIGLGRLVQNPQSARATIRRQLNELRDQAAELAQDVRALSHRLHPAILEHLGLNSALRSLCARISQSEGIPIRFVADRGQPPNREISLSLYRIAQESLHNVAKHSQASQAEVRLEHSKNRFRMRVRDDGIGFSRRADADDPGIGLTGMAERARLVGGRFHVQSSPRRGTTICVSVPADAGKPTKQE